MAKHRHRLGWSSGGVSGIKRRLALEVRRPPGELTRSRREIPALCCYRQQSVSW